LPSRAFRDILEKCGDMSRGISRQPEDFPVFFSGRCPSRFFSGGGTFGIFFRARQFFPWSGIFRSEFSRRPGFPESRVSALICPSRGFFPERADTARIPRTWRIARVFARERRARRLSPPPASGVPGAVSAKRAFHAGLSDPRRFPAISTRPRGRRRGERRIRTALVSAEFGKRPFVGQHMVLLWINSLIARGIAGARQPDAAPAKRDVWRRQAAGRQGRSADLCFLAANVAFPVAR
jgi:hypothetical protein